MSCSKYIIVCFLLIGNFDLKAMNNFYDNIEPGPVVPPKPCKKGESLHKYSRCSLFLVFFCRGILILEGRKSDLYVSYRQVFFIKKGIMSRNICCFPLFISRRSFAQNNTSPISLWICKSNVGSALGLVWRTE